MPRFKKKPVEIEAWQFTVPTDMSLAPMWIEHAVTKWPEVGGISFEKVVDIGPCVVIKTLEGTMTAIPGDWIIRGVKGELYPCKPDIFEMTYSPAEPMEKDESLEGCFEEYNLMDRADVEDRARHDAILYSFVQMHLHGKVDWENALTMAVCVLSDHLTQAGRELIDLTARRLHPEYQTDGGVIRVLPRGWVASMLATKTNLKETLDLIHKMPAYTDEDCEYASECRRITQAVWAKAEELKMDPFEDYLDFMSLALPTEKEPA